jgi:D-alanyl-D-alanine carboxypeptidase/D-alanyl-D-alanine-endopeptidase (penicillin-binding protein 4)
VFTYPDKFSNLLPQFVATTQGAAVRRLVLFLIFFILGSLSSTAEARTKNAHYAPHHVTGTAELITEINNAMHRISPSAHVGITIKSMKYGDVLYTKNEKSLFVPASTSKVFTAEAALLYLGPEFKFPTRFVTDARSISNGVLDGNIYLVNSGDPSLTYYDVADLIQTLKSQQINTITGNVYIDNTAYDQTTTGPGWLWHDTKFCYGAPISASIINHNCLSFRVTPSQNSGDQANVITDPRSYYASIRNSVVTRSHGSRTCYVKLDGENGGTIAISGCLAKGNDGAGVSTVVTNIMQYDKALVTDLMKHFDIQIQGTVTAGIASAQASELARHESKPLKDLITNMLKMSDNIIAGSIFKKIGELYTHRQGTWENGGNAVSRILSQRGVDIWRMSLIDGSGLSRYNQVTPQQMLQVLDFAWHNPDTNMHFVSALPVAGVDGTLKHRLRNIAWKVRAKTGTMQGVVSLAGYATSADKEPFAFVIMINGHNGSIWQYREFEDRIMNSLTHYSRS